jgi:uncharacterized cofD-like protein
MQRAKLSQYVEQLLEAVLNGTVPSGIDGSAISRLAEEARRFECKTTRVVAFGGGTGLSTVVGGNSQLDDWPENPFVGLKQEFPSIDVVVCTTDDGGSTGLLLKQLPMVGIGDLRKLLLSRILFGNLQRIYRFDDVGTMQLIRVIHRVLNYRFPIGRNDFRTLSNPLLIVPMELRQYCPEPLKRMLCSLGRYVSPAGEGPSIKPGGHCLGNLILAAAILRESPDKGKSPPDLKAIYAGLDLIAGAIGATPGRLHPATSSIGQLVLRYSNGVAVRGQSKSAFSRRNFAVDRVAVEFCQNPVVNQKLCQAIREADLIVFAPGSVYTSIMPILQIHPILDAIKGNVKALKILGANFWIQEGETDISRRRRDRGYYVSDLVEAYEHNVPGGTRGLFDVVLSANLEHIPGNVLRNYTLEGKSPIFLDRSQVEALGVLALEATVYSRRRLTLAQVIHHDPHRFALAVRALLLAHQQFNLKREVSRPAIPTSIRYASASASPLCSYRNSVNDVLTKKRFSPKILHRTFQEIVWENRDIRIEHLKYFQGVTLVAASRWSRSKEWDNVLGYYEPEDGMLKLHEQLHGDHERMKDNLLVAFGESLLGRYLENRRWIVQDVGGDGGARCYEIRLRPVKDRWSFLDDSQLRTYLTLSRMIPSPHDPRTYRITLNGDEGFLPPGLLFGLLYAWYLNNTYGEIMEYEMSLLHWPPQKLIPYQLEERKRKQALIAFFRNVIFKHADR